MKTIILLIAVLCTGCSTAQLKSFHDATHGPLDKPLTMEQQLKDYNRAMGIIGTCTTVKNGNTFTTRCTEAPR